MGNSVVGEVFQCKTSLPGHSFPKKWLLSVGKLASKLLIFLRWSSKCTPIDPSISQKFVFNFDDILYGDTTEGYVFVLSKKRL